MQHAYKSSGTPPPIAHFLKIGFLITFIFVSAPTIAFMNLGLSDSQTNHRFWMNVNSLSIKDEIDTAEFAEEESDKKQEDTITADIQTKGDFLEIGTEFSIEESDHSTLHFGCIGVLSEVDSTIKNISLTEIGLVPDISVLDLIKGQEIAFFVNQSSKNTAGIRWKGAITLASFTHKIRVALTGSFNPKMLKLFNLIKNNQAFSSSKDYVFTPSFDIGYTAHPIILGDLSLFLEEHASLMYQLHHSGLREKPIHIPQMSLGARLFGEYKGFSPFIDVTYNTVPKKAEMVELLLSANPSMPFVIKTGLQFVNDAIGIDVNMGFHKGNDEGQKTVTEIGIIYKW